MEQLDTASTVGTWVGAAVGIVALVGIVAPLLVWRASRTERHRAIASIGNDSNGFVTSGLPVFRGIRLFQGVHAPDLQNAFPEESQICHWNVSKLSETRSSSNWVQFGGLLKAYEFKFATKDNLFIDNVIPYLPADRTWILMIGLLGRYADREDQGQLEQQKRAQGLRLEPYTTAESWKQQAPRGTLKPILYGVTGSLTIQTLKVRENPSPVAVVDYQRHLGLLSTESEYLDTVQLTMLATGCVPMNNESYFCVASVSGPDYVIFLDAMEVDSVSVLRRAPTVQSKIRPGPRRQEPEISYVMLELSKIVECDHVFNAIGTTFLRGSKTVLTLERTKPSDHDMHQIETFADITFVPATFPWVRLETTSRNDSLFLYIKRLDAQRMALALLLLPWHIESYLISRDESSICFRLLTSVSSNLLSLVSRVHHGIEYLGLNENDKQALREALLSVLSNLSSHRIGRSLSHSFYKLDRTLDQINPGNRRISEMVGILMLTNLEFATLIRQSVRRLDRTTNVTVPVDCTRGVIQVPTAFGPVQEFVVDREELWPKETPNGLLQETYTSILLASVQACLRSKMLQTSFDGRPLLKHVAGLKDQVFLS